MRLGELDLAAQCRNPAAEWPRPIQGRGNCVGFHWTPRHSAACSALDRHAAVNTVGQSGTSRRPAAAECPSSGAPASLTAACLLPRHCAIARSPARAAGGVRARPAEAAAMALSQSAPARSGLGYQHDAQARRNPVAGRPGPHTGTRSALWHAMAMVMESGEGHREHSASPPGLLWSARRSASVSDVLPGRLRVGFVEHSTSPGRTVILLAPVLAGEAMSGYRAAIDFGTSYTVAASRSSAQAAPVVVPLVQEGRLSSAVALDDSGVPRAGALVDQVAALTPDRVERTPKRSLDQPDVLLAGKPIETADLVAAVLDYVQDELHRQFNGRDADEVVLTHPARWEHGDPRMRRLEEAAHQVGLGAVSGSCPEPCAAALGLAADLADSKSAKATS